MGCRRKLTTAGHTLNVYDADGNRIVCTDSNGTSVYAGGQEIHISSTGTVKATRYYSFAGKTVAIRTHPDHHGTPVAAIPNGGHPATTAIDRLYTDLRRHSRCLACIENSRRQPIPRKIRDGTTGLTQIGARYYDEMVGAFISPDPLLDLNDPQQWNAYAYANRNPVSRADPTGLRPDQMSAEQWKEEKRKQGTTKSGASGAGAPASVDPPVDCGRSWAMTRECRWTFARVVQDLGLCRVCVQALQPILFRILRERVPDHERLRRVNARVDEERPQCQRHTSICRLADRAYGS